MARNDISWKLKPKTEGDLLTRAPFTLAFNFLYCIRSREIDRPKAFNRYSSVEIQHRGMNWDIVATGSSNSFLFMRLVDFQNRIHPILCSALEMFPLPGNYLPSRSPCPHIYTLVGSWTLYEHKKADRWIGPLQWMSQVNRDIEPGPCSGIFSTYIRSLKIEFLSANKCFFNAILNSFLFHSPR